MTPTFLQSNRAFFKIFFVGFTLSLAPLPPPTFQPVSEPMLSRELFARLQAREQLVDLSLEKHGRRIINTKILESLAKSS